MQQVKSGDVIRVHYLGRLVSGEIFWLMRAYDLFPHKDKFFNAYFDQLAGTKKLKQQIIDKVPEPEIRKSWEPGIEAFKKIRQKYLLYKDF